jgi:hypothetical protein
VSYTRSPSAVLHPVESSRYLAILAVTLPAVLWPLLTAGRLSGLRRGWPRAVAAAAGGAVVVAVAALALSATAAVLRTAPAAADGERAQAELVAALDGAGVREVYSDYWTCNRLTFATRERIACAVVTATLGRGHDRYAAYRERVDGAPRAAYVLRRGSDELSSFERWRAAHAPGSERVATRDYLVYVVTERPDATRD